MTFPNFFIFFIDQLFLIFNQMLSIRAFGRREDVVCYSTDNLCLLCLCKPVLSGHTRRPKIGFPDKLSLSEGVEYCRMI